MDADVIIVGAGPTGLMLAVELRLAGVRPVVLERYARLRSSRLMADHESRPILAGQNVSKPSDVVRRPTACGGGRTPLILHENAGPSSLSCPITASPSGSEAVSPGDSMPKRCTKPGTPCSREPCTRKSAAGAPLPEILGRMPA